VRYSFAFVLLLICAHLLHAQVVEVHGGSSTLFDSKGGEIEIKANSYDASLGAGTIGSHFMGGAAVTKRFEGSTLTFGTETIPFNLPTDIFDASHYLTTAGGSLRKSLPNASVLLFGGMISENFDSPFFEGTHGEQPAAIFLFDGRIAPTVSVASRMIVARQITMIEGIAWKPTGWAQLAASGGVGAGKSYGAVSAKIKYSVFDFKTAYIQASPGFRRANIDTILTAEPDRFNASLTFSPNRRFSATVGHSQYLMPVPGSDTDTRSSIDQLEANTEMRGVGLTGSIFRSTFQGGANKAFVLSASRAIGPRVHMQGSYLHSDSSHGPATTSLVTAVSETITPRWSISQIVNTSNGQSTLGFGTSILSNRATFSADYETYYLPEHLPSPFEQALIINADLNVFNRATLHGGTFVAPDGSVKHTVAANGIFARDTNALPANERNPLDRFVILGRVVDELNRPVEGAALLIDRVPVYTDSEGNFILREHQPRYHALVVLNREFLGGGEYMVVNASHNIRSTLPDEATITVIVVQRLGRLCAHGVPCKR
jgi:hypothetical protein